MGVGGQPQAAVALPPGKKPDAHCTVGWVRPTAGLDGCGDIHHRTHNIFISSTAVFVHSTLRTNVGEVAQRGGD
jgi:hypothetical protein